MYFVIKLSKLCNLRCEYCYEYDELGNKEKMSLEQLESFFAHVADYFQQQEFSPEFVFHGGEPLLLPEHYFRDFCSLQEKYLTQRGISFRNSLQTNLVHLSDRTLDLLEELNISLGVSFDVFGGQRIDIKGKDSRDQVVDNLQKLIDRKIPFGVINVVHALNIDYILNTYHFFNNLGITYRMLPVSNSVEPSERMKPLMIDSEQILEAYKAVTLEQFKNPSHIRIYPLWDYFIAAVRYLLDRNIRRFNPSKREWVTIVNLNGDLYNYGEAYLPEGYMGNIFDNSLTDILNSPEHNQTIIRREMRMETCRSCPFDQKCHQIPIAEMQGSDRTYDTQGNLQCTVAKPMIEFMIEQIQKSPQAQAILELYSTIPRGLELTFDAKINV
ncbi:Radical SAM domain protein [Cyanobacterium stanieri PCC 7202]|uniref:Radical SAM domain protein n=1 Tax=Cyanobacterium stanieri (strain ATCC 29140 / PCC 7202) TaxID=292563 RepID=K9YMJ0_CYASC|nr:Radical SAM domain protein [Cyanobacterium stanieri PCC 7202]